MGAIRTRGILERYGFSREQFGVLHELAARHHDRKGGQHTNGGCRGGRCDYGSPSCAAWSQLLEIIEEHLPRREPLCLCYLGEGHTCPVHETGEGGRG